MKLLLLAITALLSAPQSWLAAPLPEGFVVAHKQSAANGRIEERVAKGETVEDWSRMVTLLRLNADVPKETYVEAFVATVLRACPGATATPRAAASLGGASAIGGRVDCALNAETGKPESFFYRVGNADGGVLMAQVAFRRVPDADDARWAAAQLDSIIVCTPDSTDALCTAS